MIEDSEWYRAGIDALGADGLVLVPGLLDGKSVKFICVARPLIGATDKATVRPIAVMLEREDLPLCSLPDGRKLRDHTSSN